MEVEGEPRGREGRDGFLVRELGRGVSKMCFAALRALKLGSEFRTSSDSGSITVIIKPQVIRPGLYIRYNCS
jgi:hypothetical protein